MEGSNNILGHNADLDSCICKRTYIKILKGKVILFLSLLTGSHSQNSEPVNSHSTALPCPLLNLRKQPKLYPQDSMFKLLIINDCSDEIHQRTWNPHSIIFFYNAN